MRYRSRIGTVRDLASSRSAGQTAGHSLCAEFWSSTGRRAAAQRWQVGPDDGGAVPAASINRRSSRKKSAQPPLNLQAAAVAVDQDCSWLTRSTLVTSGVVPTGVGRCPDTSQRGPTYPISELSTVEMPPFI